MDSAGMVSAVQAGGVDATNSLVLDMLNSVYSAVVAGGRWRVSEYSLGNTVAGQAGYPLAAEVVDVESVKVGSAPYRRLGTRQVWQLVNATGPDALYLTPGVAGVFAPDFDSGGAAQVVLYPTPTVVAAITGLAALEPVALTGVGGNNTILPADLDPRLVDATIALGKGRVNGDQAAGQLASQLQDQLGQELRKRRNARVGGGPAYIDMSGF